MRVGWIVTSGLLILVWLARGLLLPILLAAMLAYLLGPAITWADTLAIRRTVAVAILYVVIITVLVVAGYLLGPGLFAEASTLIDRLPTLTQKADAGLDAAVRELGGAAPALGRPPPEGGRWMPRFIPRRAP